MAWVQLLRLSILANLIPILDVSGSMKIALVLLISIVFLFTHGSVKPFKDWVLCMVAFSVDVLHKY